MLHAFLIEHQKELIARTDAKAAKRPPPKTPHKEFMQHGVPLFITQLAAVLRAEAAQAVHVPGAVIRKSASQHGGELLRMGFTVDSVVHTYGDVCQAVTELAHTLKFTITTDEFHTLNRALDDAIAGAVTEYGRQREADIATGETARLGLAFEQRNLLSSALLAWEMLRNGTVGLAGNTAEVLTHSLEGLRGLNNRSHTGAQIPDPSKMDK
jgi:hypothetical protein